MNIFIGSSKESIVLVRELEMWIQENNHTPIPWDMPGLLRPGDSTFETLIRLSNEVQAAIFLFTEDDKLWYRNNEISQPRDNVILEYGLFLGRIGKHNSIILKSGYPKTASDILGINLIDISNINKARGRIEFNLWCKNVQNYAIKPNSIDNYIRERNEIPNFQTNVQDSSEIWVAAKSLTNLLNQYGLFISKEAQKGKRFKFLIHNPEKDYMMLSVITNSATNQNIEKVKQMGQESIKLLNNYRFQLNNDNIELKVTNAPLYCGYTIMNPKMENGIIYQELFGYKISLGQRLSAIYKKADSNKLFNYHLEQFNKLWDDAE